MFNNFNRDLEIAMVYEKKIAKYLAKRFNLEVMEFNNDWRYDFKLKNSRGDIKKFEVKTDFLTKKTGNVCFEVDCLKKSEADLYIYIIVFDNIDIIFIFNKEHIIYYINNSCMVKGGDFGKPLALYRYEDIKKYILKKEIKKIWL